MRDDIVRGQNQFPWMRQRMAIKRKTPKSEVAMLVAVSNQRKPGVSSRGTTAMSDWLDALNQPGPAEIRDANEGIADANVTYGAPVRLRDDFESWATDADWKARCLATEDALKRAMVLLGDADDLYSENLLDALFDSDDGFVQDFYNREVAS